MRLAPRLNLQYNPCSKRTLGRVQACTRSASARGEPRIDGFEQECCAAERGRGRSRVADGAPSRLGACQSDCGSGGPHANTNAESGSGRGRNADGLSHAPRPRQCHQHRHRGQRYRAPDGSRPCECDEYRDRSYGDRGRRRDHQRIRHQRRGSRSDQYGNRADHRCPRNAGCASERDQHGRRCDGECDRHTDSDCQPNAHAYPHTSPGYYANSSTHTGRWHATGSDAATYSARPSRRVTGLRAGSSKPDIRSDYFRKRWAAATSARHARATSRCLGAQQQVVQQFDGHACADQYACTTAIRYTPAGGNQHASRRLHCNNADAGYLALSVGRGPGAITTAHGRSTPSARWHAGPGAAGSSGRGRPGPAAATGCASRRRRAARTTRGRFPSGICRGAPARRRGRRGDWDQAPDAGSATLKTTSTQSARCWMRTFRNWADLRYCVSWVVCQHDARNAFRQAGAQK